MMIVHHNLAYGFIFELFDQYINAYVDYSKTLRALSNLNVKWKNLESLAKFNFVI